PRKNNQTIMKRKSKLRARYNHTERKNHTKFFAKLFSHWLKTPLFRLHPLFYRERSPQLHQLWLPKATRERKRLPLTQRFPPLRVAKIWVPFLLPLRYIIQVDLNKPDILHVIYLGIFQTYLMKWVV